MDFRERFIEYRPIQTLQEKNSIVERKRTLLLGAALARPALRIDLFNRAAILGLIGFEDVGLREIMMLDTSCLRV